MFCVLCDACPIFKILYYVHVLFTTTNQVVKEFIYWFWKSIVFVSWCLVDGWFWWTTISVNFLPYVFNLRLMYFLATILNKEDGWSYFIPNLCSKKWPGTLLKMSGPSCAHTAHSIFMSRFFSVFLSMFWPTTLLLNIVLVAFTIFNTATVGNIRPPFHHDTMFCSHQVHFALTLSYGKHQIWCKHIG